ncbi:hypothetical protein, partial [Caballeronia terrestris]|uniref:hypothetical protein n=1 Tax=Caballeronia terrestris TaxID=1226301 RepID=UPI001356B66F
QPADEAIDIADASSKRLSHARFVLVDEPKLRIEPHDARERVRHARIRVNVALALAADKSAQNAHVAFLPPLLFFARRHHVDVDRAVLPVQVVNPPFKTAQRMRLDVVESQQHRGPRTGARDALDS